ncbi:hypothetical protein FRC19_007708 [Serendipita sp. 401]|nr:hypothetical protein FRC19_007708 [Serendipita sp. 401]
MSVNVVLKPRNGPPTREEDRRIRQFILKQNDFIRGLEARVSEAKVEVKACGGHIRMLETGILGGRAMLDGLRTAVTPLLEALVDVKASVIIEGEANVDSQPDAGSYRSILSNLSTQKESILSTLETSITSLQHEEDHMSKHLAKLELELHGWRESLVQSRNYLEHCSESLSHATSDLFKAKCSLKAHWKLPIEIWREIFRNALHSTFMHFLAEADDKPFHPFTLTIASVCRAWRTIVLQDPTMFSNITGHASSFWLPCAKYLLDLFLERTVEPFTVVINSSQENVPVDDSNSAVCLDETGGEKHYHVLVRIGNIDSSFSEDLDEHPYHTPRELTLINNSDHLDGDIFDFIAPFASKFLHRLIIKDPIPQFFEETVNLSPNLTDLTYLSFEAAEFSEGFDFTSLLCRQLIELHIRHTKDTRIPALPNVVELPELRVLGITPPSTEFIKCLRLPKVDKLVLYGTKVSRNPQTPPATAVGGLYARIVELGFHHWEAIDGSEKVPTVIGILKKMKGTCRRLTKVSFFDTWVDGTTLREVVAKDRRKFANLTLDQCTGVTQTDCIELMSLVEKLVVVV